MLDTLLSNARIVDGTGAPPFHGHVGVVDGRIDSVVRGRYPGLDADERVDVDRMVVAPGFIDAHSKSDVQPFADPLLEPKVRQGITTEIVGHDGYSMAPLDGVDRAEYRDILGGMGRGLEEWTWTTTAEYLDELDGAVAPNIGTLVGHGTVRYNVMGLRDDRPTDAELDEMRRLVAGALEAGALGLSTGLIYPPQMHSDRAELAALAGELRDVGRPLVAHVRSQGQGVWSAVDELHDVGVEVGVPVQHTHIQLSGADQGGKADRLLSLMAATRERGADLTANQHPYKAGSTQLRALLPPRFQSQTAAETVEQLRDPDVREAIRRDIEEWRVDGWENLAGLTGWENLVVASVDSAERSDLEGRSLTDVAADRDDRPVDVLCDLLVEEGVGGVDVLLHKLSEADVRTFLAAEHVSVCTDGLFGDHPHPRTYGTYPRILREYVREEGLLSLEGAVRKMTSLPARQYGLDRKGVVRPGMDADLVVFDPDVVADRATYDDPTQFPRGILSVLVDGTFVVRDGETTGATPGAGIRA